MTTNRSVLILVTLIASTLLSGCGTTTPPVAPAPAGQPTALNNPVSNSMPATQDLRADLEKLYLSARASVDESTPDTFLTLVEVPNASPAQEQKLRETWSDPQSQKALKTFVFTDLAQTEFVQVKQVGEDWAGYYYLTDLEEAGRLNVSLMRFHRVGGAWKIHMRLSTSSDIYEPEAGKSRAQAIQDVISDSDSLKEIVPSGT